MWLNTEKGLKRGQMVLQVYTMHPENLQKVVQVVIRESKSCSNAQRWEKGQELGSSSGLEGPDKGLPSLKPPYLFKTYTEGPTAAPVCPLFLGTFLTAISNLCHLDRESFLVVFDGRRSRPGKSLLLFRLLEVQVVIQERLSTSFVSTPRVV